MAKTILTIAKISNDRYARIVETLAWLIRYGRYDMQSKSNKIYVAEVIDLNDNVKVGYFNMTTQHKENIGDIMRARMMLTVVRNDGMTAGTPVLIGTDLITLEKRESLGKLVTEFDLYYDEECEDEIDVVEYNEVVEEVLDEIYALASLHKMEIPS